MDRKIALVTGGNKGIGLEVVRQLAQQGFTVLLGARSLPKARAAAEQLKGLDVRPVELDVTRAEHIASVAGYIGAEFGRLDVLVNNAGIYVDGRGPAVDAFRETYETNVIAPFQLTQALLPLLEKSPAGRVVNQSSIIGSITVIGSNDQALAWAGPAYASSKAALNMLTVWQARKLAGTRIKVNAAHPGWVKTELGGPEAPLDTTAGAKTAVSLALLGEEGPTGGLFHDGQPLPW